MVLDTLIYIADSLSTLLPRISLLRLLRTSVLGCLDYVVEGGKRRGRHEMRHEVRIANGARVA